MTIHRVDGANLEDELAGWLRDLDGPRAGKVPRGKVKRARAARTGRSAVIVPSSAAALVRMNGRVATFADEVGGRVALLKAGAHHRHPGAVSVAALPPEAWVRAAGDPARAAVIRVVATWLGQPFDALAVLEREGGAGWLWGAFGLDPRRTAAAIARWKEADRGSFTTWLGAFEVDVEAAEPGPLVRTPAAEGLVRDEAAVTRILADPVRAAALARAGRCEAAQRAQIEVVVPLIPDRPTLPARAAGLAVALGWLPALAGEADGAGGLVQVAGRLAAQGRTREALACLRLATAPELEDRGGVEVQP